MRNIFSAKLLLISAIIVLGAFMRLYRLGDLPSLNADEAALGYNAYSLLETGKDEHGHPWPIHFQSFNDWKPGLTVYLIMPSIALFGLTEWGVRIIPVLLSISTIGLLYLFVNEFTKNKNHALLAAFFLAISPWHIHFSRGAWEVNIATFFMLLGTYLFLRAFKNNKLFIFSVISFALSLYAYHASRVVIPLLGLSFAVIYFKELKNNLKMVSVALLIGIIVLLPLGADFLKPESLSRAAGVGLFADPGPRSRIEEQRGQHTDYKTLLPKVIHNKAVNYGLAFLKNWTAHYHGEFLFLSGDEIQRNRVPETGQLYTIDALLIFIGLCILIGIFKDQPLNEKKAWYIVLWWLLIGPVAAALTFQAPHALRAENMIIPLTIISSYGALQILMWAHAKNTTIKNVTSVVLMSIMFLSVSRYLLMYYSHMIKEYPYSSQYGVKELVNFIKPISNDYDKILITDRYDQPYILFLFYTKYPPQEFQKEGKLTARDGFGFSTVRSFSIYEFRSIKFDEDRPTYKNSLIIGTQEEIPKEANIIEDIYGPNGFLYFRVVEN